MIFKYGGVSVKGKHELNQDSFICKKIKNIYVLVVSDGLGSEKYSHIGSSVICDVICNAILENKSTDDMKIFIKNIHRKWLYELRFKHNIVNTNDCSATCLFCIVNKKEVILCQLGDGFICYIDNNNEIVMQDDSDSHFINETDCLSKKHNIDLWKIRRIQKPKKFGFSKKMSDISILMSTDGLVIGNGDKEDIISFLKEFEDGYKKNSDNEMNKDIKRWLSDWYGSDDKTIAYILRSYQNE